MSHFTKFNLGGRSHARSIIWSLVSYNEIKSEKQWKLTKLLSGITADELKALWCPAIALGCMSYAIRWSLSNALLPWITFSIGMYYNMDIDLHNKYPLRWFGSGLLNSHSGTQSEQIFLVSRILMILLNKYMLETHIHTVNKMCSGKAVTAT